MDTGRRVNWNKNESLRFFYYITMSTLVTTYGCEHCHAFKAYIAELEARVAVIEARLCELSPHHTEEAPEHKIKKSGAGAVKSGRDYERQVHNLLKQVIIKESNEDFHTQRDDELAGCTAGCDIKCNWEGVNDIGIELKANKTPDWTQCSLKYHADEKCWKGSIRGKIPEYSRRVFDNILRKVTLFNGKTPPHCLRQLTHAEWLKIKEEDADYQDHYVDIEDNTISRLYRAKGCQYIQVGGYGLYHLGKDVCEFGVPRFVCSQRMRIRIKVHKRKNKHGFCSLSVSASAQVKDYNTVPKSEYSLDDVAKLPPVLILSE